MAEWSELNSQTVLLTGVGVPVEEWLELHSLDLSLQGVTPPIEEWVELGSVLLLLRGQGVPPVECTVNADCPEGYVCVDGVCVPEEEAKKFSWVPVALIGGGAAVVALAMKPKIKKA